MLIVAPPGTRIQFASCSTALWAHIQMKRGLKCGSVFFQVAWLANICFSYPDSQTRSVLDEPIEEKRKKKSNPATCIIHPYIVYVHKTRSQKTVHARQWCVCVLSLIHI